MYVNIKSGVVVFIILLFIFGCMSLKTHVVYEKPVQSLYVKEFRTGSENFVFLLKELDPFICIQDSCDPVLGPTASGFVFSSDSNSIFVMTAAHFCVVDDETSIFFNEKIIGFANDTPRDMHILYLDKESDLCMLFGVKNSDESFFNIKLADEVMIGEELHTVAAPEGMGGPEKRLIFTGIFGGCDEQICMSTISASFGSSGAGIYNKKGELLSIVMAIHENYNHVVLSPSQKQVRNFIENIDQVVDIYPYE